jgi:hypothetical protein
MYIARNLVLLVLLAPCFASAQNITPGKYTLDEASVFHRAEYKADGSASIVTEHKVRKGTFLMEFRWAVRNGRFEMSATRFTKDRVNWQPVEDASVEIRNVSPRSFELKRNDGNWMKWTREP